jgi:hypothetical protein
MRVEGRVDKFSSLSRNSQPSSARSRNGALRDVQISKDVPQSVKLCQATTQSGVRIEVVPR